MAKPRVKTVYRGARNLHCIGAHKNVKKEIYMHTQYVKFS